MTAFRLIATEGHLEEPVARKLFSVLRISDRDAVYVRPRGSFWVRVPKYNEAARHGGLVLGLADLETHPCPSGLIAEHLPHGKHPQFVMRIAERMLESWLLADGDSLAGFLKVATSIVPRDPEAEEHPKRTLVNLARRSPDRSIRDDLVPEEGSRGVAGPGYRLRMAEYVDQRWQPLTAAGRSQSLQRAIAAIKKAAGA